MNLGIYCSELVFLWSRREYKIEYAFDQRRNFLFKHSNIAFLNNIAYNYKMGKSA